MKSLAFHEAAQHSVHPTGGSLRVFGQFAWLEVGSVKVALSLPAHQRVTPAVNLRVGLPDVKSFDLYLHIDRPANGH